MQIEKRFKSYPTLYREQSVSFICAPIWALLRPYLARTLFASTSTSLGCTTNTITPTLSLEFTEVQGGRAADVYQDNTMK